MFQKKHKEFVRSNDLNLASLDGLSFSKCAYYCMIKRMFVKDKHFNNYKIAVITVWPVP